MGDPRPPVRDRPTTNPDAVLAQLDRLPTLPAIALRLLQTTADDEGGARELIALLRADQSLTAKVLALASSTGAGLGRPVRTLEQAVPLLGFSGVRSAVLAAGVFECFRSTEVDADSGFDLPGFWLHALAVANAAREIAKARGVREPHPEQAYLAGLLHDLGKVALATVFPKGYARAARRAQEERSDIADVERTIFGVDHTRAGRKVADQWRLPPELRDVIWLHHVAGATLPPSAADRDLIAIVQLADTLAREQRVGFSGNFVFFEHSPALAARLGLDGGKLDAIAAGMVQAARTQAEQFGISHPTPAEQYVRAMAQANAELGRINTDLSISNQKLAVAARYFNALCAFDQRIGPWAELPMVVESLLAAVREVWPDRPAAAFAVADDAAAIELAWQLGDHESGAKTLNVLPDKLAHWLREPIETSSTLPAQAPAALHSLFAAAAGRSPNAFSWFAPILQYKKLVGGLLLGTTDDAGPQTLDASDDLRAFLNALGLAISRTHAQRQARRITDELAESNRRLQQIQVELLRSRSLTMIAEMASGAAHELNSPLTVISGRSQMLAQSISEPEQQRLLNVIQDKAHECSHIVSELMEFARPRPPQCADVDLIELLTRLRSDYSAERSFPPSRFTIQTRELEAGRRAGEPLPRAVVWADARQMEQLLRAVIDNAVEAVQTGGAISATIQPTTALDGFEIRIADNGPGMPPHVVERAFDPFFSHRPAGRRRGLGLAHAYRIIEAHRGRIWLDSTPNRGTTVHIVLLRHPTPSS